VLRYEKWNCVIRVWFHYFLGISGNLSVKRVRIRYRVQILTGIHASLRVLGACLVKSSRSKPTRVISPGLPRFSLLLPAFVDGLLLRTGFGKTCGSFYPRAAPSIRRRHFLYTVFYVTRPIAGGYQVVDPFPNRTG